MNEFAFIDAEKAKYPIELLCNVLEVSRPGCYAYKRRGLSKRATRDADLGAKIVTIHRKAHPYVPTSPETVAPRYLCTDGRRMDLQACRSHPMFLVEKTSPPRAGASGLRRA